MACFRRSKDHCSPTVTTRKPRLASSSAPINLNIKPLLTRAGCRGFGHWALSSSGREITVTSQKDRYQVKWLLWSLLTRENQIGLDQGLGVSWPGLAWRSCQFRHLEWTEGIPTAGSKTTYNPVFQWDVCGPLLLLEWVLTGQWRSVSPGKWGVDSDLSNHHCFPYSAVWLLGPLTSLSSECPVDTRYLHWLLESH